MPYRRTYADRAEYIKAAVAKRRKKVRAMLVEYKGGKCRLCGYRRCIQALELHHLLRASKDFGISAHGLTRAWKKVQREADKCILICANCHRELHAGIRQLPREIEVVKRGELREA